MLPPLPLLTAASLGYASHALYFRHGEHHQYGVLYLQLATGTVVASLCGTLLLTENSFLPALSLVLQASGAFLLSALLSTAAYRLSPSHRLADFPGPRAWRVTRLAQVWANRRSRGFEALDRLHAEYGEFVRTGPSDVSITDPDAVDAVLGVKSRCTKAPWYDINPLHSILTVRDEQGHKELRRAYEQGLRESALASYESRITDSIAEFEGTVLLGGAKAQASFAAVGINVTRWIKLLVLDINNKIAFSKAPACVETGKSTPGLHYLEDGFHFLGIMGPMPWLFIMMLRIPFVRKEFNRGAMFCAGLVGDRLKAPHSEPDVVSSIVQSMSPAGSNDEIAFNLRGEGNVLIIAANDTITNTLVWTLRHLARTPEHVRLLRQELDELRAQDGGGMNGLPSAKTLRSHAKFLDAVIYEAMRLHPSVPGGSFRTTPPEGIQVGKRHVPGNTIVSIPQWSLMRSPKCFVRPEEFLPERWTTSPELILRRDAWIPFHVGTYSCVGRQLALMETRLILAHLLDGFDISLAAGESGDDVFRLAIDHFNMTPGPLNISFKKRAVNR